MGKQEVAVWLYDALGTGYPCSHPWSRHNYCPLPPEDRKRVLHPLPCLDFQSLESHAGHPGLPGSHQWSLQLAWQALTLGLGISFSGIVPFSLHLFFELRGFSCSSQLWQVEPECPGCQIQSGKFYVVQGVLDKYQIWCKYAKMQINFNTHSQYIRPRQASTLTQMQTQVGTSKPHRNLVNRIFSLKPQCKFSWTPIVSEHYQKVTKKIGSEHGEGILTFKAFDHLHLCISQHC